MCEASLTSENVHFFNVFVQICIEASIHVESARVHLCNFQSLPPNRKNLHISNVFFQIHTLILSLVEEALLRPKVNLVTFLILAAATSKKNPPDPPPAGGVMSIV